MTAQAEVEARPTQTMPLPERAAAKMAVLRQQVEAAQLSYSQYIGGVLDGLGVDYEANDVSITPDGKSYTVSPKPLANGATSEAVPAN